MSAALRRAAVIADVMVKRALPSVLELAARYEDDIRILEADHVTAEVASVPRRFHPRDDVQDGRSVGLWAGDSGRRKQRGRQARQGGLHSWNCPAITVWHWPPRKTRCPSNRQLRTPVRSLACRAVNSLRPRRSAQ